MFPNQAASAMQLLGQEECIINWRIARAHFIAAEYAGLLAAVDAAAVGS